MEYASRKSLSSFTTQMDSYFLLYCFYSKIWAEPWGTNSHTVISFKEEGLT